MDALGIDQEVRADVLSRHVDRRRACCLEYPQGAVALGDRLASKHHAYVTVERLHSRRSGVVPDGFLGSLRLHRVSSTEEHPTLRPASVPRWKLLSKATLNRLRFTSRVQLAVASPWGTSS